MEPEPGSPRLTTSGPLGTCGAAWRSLAGFLACFLATTLALAAIAIPWVTLSWWQVLRRCASIAAALSLWYVITQRERRSFRDYGLAYGRGGKRQFLFGLSLGVMALGLLLGVGLMTGACHVQLTPDRVKLWRTLISFIPIAVLISVLEELVFRGFILQHLMACSRMLAIAVSSISYAVVHFKTLHSASSLCSELMGLTLLGGVLAWCYLRTRQLYLAIGLHAALAYGARVNKLLIGFSDPSMAWLVGTNRLVNGLAGWLVLLGLGAIVTWWTRPTPTGRRP